MKTTEEIVQELLDLGGAFELACSDSERNHIKDEALKLYNQTKAENLPISGVSNRRERLIAYTLKMLSCTDEQAEKMVDSYLSLYGT